jgi:hypothetical protein
MDRHRTENAEPGGRGKEMTSVRYRVTPSAEPTTIWNQERPNHNSHIVKRRYFVGMTIQEIAPARSPR